MVRPNRNVGAALVLAAALGGAAQAGVTSYRLIKGAVYSQSSNAAPTSTNSWYYYAQVFANEPNLFDLVTFDSPNDTFDQVIPPYSPYEWTISGGFPSKAAMDDKLPNGAYVYAGYLDSEPAGEGPLALDGDLYPSQIPALTGDTFARLQGLNPFAPFTVNLNAWSPPAGAQGGVIQVNIKDNVANYSGVLATYPVGTSSFVIPAGTLLPGRSYQLRVAYYCYLNTPNAGFETATAVRHFTYWNYASFSTMPWSFASPRSTEVIDFEGLAELDPVDDAYAGQGVHFSLAADPMASPIVTKVGLPQTAFVGPSIDGPMTSGSGALTDPVVAGSSAVGGDVLVSLDPPATSVRFSLVDVDASETYVVRAFNGDTEVASVTRSAGQAFTGNGASTDVALVAPSITSVLIDVPASCDWAMDHLRVARPCAAPSCGVQVRVSQESAPGVGDFDSHVLGYASPFLVPQTTSQFYGYGSTNILQGVAKVLERSTLLVAGASDGLSLVALHDRPNNVGGGRTEMEFSFDQPAEQPAFVVVDDPTSSDANDVYAATGDVATAQNVWGSGGSDGFAIKGLGTGTTVVVRFADIDDDPATASISGLVHWVMASGEGTHFTMAMAKDRRVRIEVLGGADCPADLDADGAVGPSDLGILLAAWGVVGDGDLDEDGIVGPADLGVLLGAWGSCGS